jgi:hypothetical protein
MKHILFTFALLLSTLHAQEYPIRHIPLDSPKFESIYRAYLATRAKDHAAKTSYHSIEITSHVEGTLYLAEIVRPAERSNSVFDALTGGASAFSRQMRDLQPNQAIAVDLPGSALLTDGQRIRVALEPTATPYQYESVLGAKITVPRYRTPPPPLADYSKEHFYSDIQAGNKFPVSLPKTIKCPDCLGFGGASLTRAECLACNGKGSISTATTLIIAW